MLLVQKFLETKSFGDLVREHGVYASFSKSGHKWSLNYDQLEAKESDPLSQQCRGLVLSAEDGRTFTPNVIDGRNSFDHITPGKTRIIAYPMNRFFNHGQGSAAEVNWSDPNLAVLEKLDGTLCIVYYDPFTSKWCVATRSVPEADLFMDNGIFTFRTLFEKALFDTTTLSFENYTQKLNKSITYCFELTTPYNRIVVNYADNRVTLLAARSLHDLKEFNFEDLGCHGWVKYDNLSDEIKQDIVDMGKSNVEEAFIYKRYDLIGVPVVKAYTYKTIDELVNWVSTLNPMDHEGVVVRDSNFNRVKVKNAAYVAYNKVRDTLATSSRNCVELILAEKEDDVIPFLPEEIVKNLLKIKEGVRRVILDQDDHYDSIMTAMEINRMTDKKNFALYVQAIEKKKHIWSAYMFSRFDKKCDNMKDYIKKNRNDGSWGNSFLDKFLDFSKTY